MGFGWRVKMWFFADRIPTLEAAICMLSYTIRLGQLILTQPNR